MPMSAMPRNLCGAVCSRIETMPVPMLTENLELDFARLSVSLAWTRHAESTREKALKGARPRREEGGGRDFVSV